MNNKRILITGAAGYIGHQLGNRLAAHHHVVGTDIRQRNDLDFPIHVLDVRDKGLATLLLEPRYHPRCASCVYFTSIKRSCS